MFSRICICSSQKTCKNACHDLFKFENPVAAKECLSEGKKLPEVKKDKHVWEPSYSPPPSAEKPKFVLSTVFTRQLPQKKSKNLAFHYHSSSNNFLPQNSMVLIVYRQMQYQDLGKFQSENSKSGMG